jgi:PII-like signaling protein
VSIEAAGPATSNGDCLKLTAYFGERQRTDGRFLAEDLLTLYGERAVATSVMMRGIGSFGPRKQLRSDEWLSLSEDPPVAVAAVDARDKIAGLVEDVVEMTPRGLITLERARLITDAVVPQGVHNAAKLTVYVGRQARVDGVPAYFAICDLLYREGVAGASVFLGVDGTVRGQRQRARFFSRNVDVPMMIISVGSADSIARVVPQLGAMLRQPLLTVERIRVCKRDGELLSRPDALPMADDQGRPLWQKLMVYTSSAALHDGAPIHRALIRELRTSGAASGATVLRGVWGFHGDQKPHGDKLIQLARRVPVTTIVVDRPDRIARSFEIVGDVTREHGLVTSEMVPAHVLVDGNERIGGTALADYRY